MSRKKKDDDKVSKTLQNQTQSQRKKKIREIFARAVKEDGKALEKLSKN
ncbi:hypothetical protein [Salipaludibacillus daqingensis]|nr:hypothetical protein [Salipaludibacillus daqingensis]